jgi:hypothetical protein
MYKMKTFEVTKYWPAQHHTNGRWNYKSSHIPKLNAVIYGPK